MTPKQKAFAEHFVASGNATEAAKKAGYSERSARQIAAENLSKPCISSYIETMVADREQTRVADATEVLEFYTSVMRGEVKDQFGFDASLSDRINAGKALMKRYAAIEATSKSEQVTVIIDV